MEEENDMNIIDMVQVNTKSCNCSLVLHLLIAGAEEGQGTITVIWACFTIVVVVLSYSDTSWLCREKWKETENITRQTNCVEQNEKK